MYACPFLLIFITNDVHARMTFPRFIESLGDIRLESRNVQTWNLSAAKREIISGIAGPTELAGIPVIPTARLFEMRAPPTNRRSKERQLYFKWNATYPDASPSSRNVLTPPYETEITTAPLISPIWYCRNFSLLSVSLFEDERFSLCTCVARKGWLEDVNDRIRENYYQWECGDIVNWNSRSIIKCVECEITSVSKIVIVKISIRNIYLHL